MAQQSEQTDEDILSEQIAGSQELYRHIFNLMPEVMVVVSINDGRVRDFNPSFLNTFGRQREDVLDMPAESLGIWSDPTFFPRFLHELKMNAVMNDVPTIMRTRGNMVRHFKISAQKVDQSEHPLMLMIARDITDDIIQSQELQRSRDSAELANRAKSEFLANMSHELRTPLNAILGFAEIIRDAHLGAIENRKYREYAADIHHSGSHLLSIINDILDLSKVEADRIDTQVSWIDPAVPLELCMALSERRASEAGLELITEIDAQLEIEADERLLKQIAINLVTNALKFTPEGGTVALKCLKARDGGARIVVEDSGIGMTADEIRIAKRPFGQIKGSLKNNDDGSGLGLPLVAAFAEKLDAVMAIHSTPGVGTSVQISFPPHRVRYLRDEQRRTESDVI